MKCPNCKVELTGIIDQDVEGKIDIKLKVKPKLSQVKVKSQPLGFYIYKGEGLNTRYLGTDLNFHKTMMTDFTPYLSKPYADRLVDNLHKKEKKVQQ